MRYTDIASTSNPRVKEAVAVREKRRKYKHEAFLIEGPHLVEMALQSGTSLKRVFFTEEFASLRQRTRLLKELTKHGAEMFRITAHVLSMLSDTEAPQGIIATASYEPSALDTLPVLENPLLVILDGIQDPGNLGTIIRTSDAAGADGVIMLPETCDAFMPKALRSSAGSIFNLPIVYSEAATLIPWLRGKSVCLSVADVKATTEIYQADLSQPLAFVFGNEAHGVSDILKKEASLLIRIPIFGKAESLNVATSAAICLYEAVRQRTFSKH
ncbi:MAG TPA: RNA methyltransferase [Thermodesulfovibrionales bacterium]|nr:RNA methyltransferase [Thermodesulfovibrionales bacterium]